MDTYDFVIAGGGLAGLSLACQLVRSPLCGAKILIVDRRPDALDQRLWSYWTEHPTLFDPIVSQAWSHIHVASHSHTLTSALPGCRFELVRGADLNQFARQELGRHANVTFRQGVVAPAWPGQPDSPVSVDGQAVQAGWVFDSTGWPSPAQQRAGQLAMYFRGWTVATRRRVFNSQAVTFLDTRTPQFGGLRFFYVLPVSEQRALVEYVVYADRPPTGRDAEAALQPYLATAWGLTDYQVGAEDAGCLPIVTGPHPRRLGRRRFAIGAKAGLLKPSTGFAFRRIQQDSAAIVQSLLRTGQPISIPTVSGRHRLYDALLLDVLARRGADVAAIFAALFARNPLTRVLRFLDETTSLSADLTLFTTMPARPFLAALPRLAAANAGHWLLGKPA